MPTTSMLFLAMLGCTLPGCDRKQPASTATSGSAHDSAAPRGSAESAPVSPPGNAVQTEMRMLTSILEATVRAIGARDVRPIEHELHRLHAAKEATSAALRDGSYKLPKNPEQVDAFVAMDEAFHEHLGALVSASRANDLTRTADALGTIVRACEGCHVLFRAAPAPAP
jgi:cytochrome c556